MSVTPTFLRLEGAVLRLRTLGGLDLSAADEPVHPLLSQPKRLGLLVYLSATSAHGYRRRDAILPLFWPELDAARARGALRQAMYVLRRDLGDGVIRARGEDELGVDPAALWLDVTEFEAALAAGEYRRAADLYRGDFLEGFFIPGSGQDFDEWVARERSRLRGLASRTMWVVAEATVEREPAAAASWIRRAVALAPDDELAVRQALEHLERIGDRAGALQLYQEFRDRLNREYTAEPAPETKAMAEALRVSRDPAPSVGHDLARPAGTSPSNRDLTPSNGPALAQAVRRDTGAVVRLVGSRPRRVVTGVLAALVLASAWGIFRLTAGRSSPTSLGRLSATGQLLVGDIEARPQDSLAAYALTEWLRTVLARSRAIHVVSRADVAQSLGRMQLPSSTRLDAAVAREMAIRNGYEAILNARLTPVGAGYVLSAHLTSVGGVELATASEPAASANALIPALDRLTKTLRSRLGESRQALVAFPPLQQVTTSSIRALELYTQAQDVSNGSRGNGQQPPDMFPLLREALAIDSTFAMAHRRLGAALYNLGFTREALQEFRAAARFSNKLGDVERLTVLVSLYVNLRQNDRAVADATELLRLEPGNLFVQNWLTILYLGSGQYDIAAKEIPRIAPIRTGAFWSNVREYQGRGAEALDSARANYRRYQDSTGSSILRAARERMAAFQAVQFAYDSAVVYALPRDVSDSGSPAILAASRFARGQLVKAVAIQRRRALNANGELPTSGVDAAAESYIALATMLITSDRASASRRLDRVLADTSYRNRDPADRHIGPVLALTIAGRAADARRELTAIERASNEDVRMTRKAELELARGAVALSETRSGEAIAALRRASTTMSYGSHDACRVCALPWLGRAYEAAGQPDSAAMVYERYLTTGDPFRLTSDASWRAVILRRLGTLHAQRGDTAQAVRRLAEFVELWKDADRELQPQVEDARRRLAELRGTAVRAATPTARRGDP